MSIEAKPLLLDEDVAGSESDTNLAKWTLFSLSFGFAHGSLVTGLTYGSTFLGTSTASVTLAVFYGVYTASNLLIAEGVVASYGPRIALIIGFVTYITLLAAYLVYSMLPGLEGTLLMVCGAVVGGMGGGIVWVAQTALYVAVATDTNVFATAFSAVIVSLEAAIKITIALLLYFGFNEYKAVLVLLGGTIAGLVAVAWINFGDIPTPGRLLRFENLTRVVQAHADLRVDFLAPFPLAFGFGSAFFTEWMSATVARARGAWAVGATSSLTTIVAGVFSLVLFPSQRHGKMAAVSGAVLSYTTTGVVLATCNFLGRLTSWSCLALAFAAQGANRAIFENSTKFYYAETFEVGDPNRVPAIAALYFHSGLASAVTYAFLDYTILFTAAAVFVAFAGLITLGHFLAATVGQRHHDVESSSSKT